MLEGIETLATLCSQLHRQLKGKEILVGDIPKLDIPPNHFSGGI
jgi:hypothetical protein